MAEVQEYSLDTIKRKVRKMKVTYDCATCQGTGIGQHGDPNTSRCSDCNGRGYFTEEDE